MQNAFRTSDGVHEALEAKPRRPLSLRGEWPLGGNGGQEALEAKPKGLLSLRDK